MAESWATSGVDLHLDHSGPRVRAGLEAALRDAVRDCRLGADARLPSSRALAADLGVARNTVVEAYGQLVAEGWLIARRGSGTRVASQAPPPAPATPELASTARQTPLRHDLRAGSPDTAAFPRASWLSAARRALSKAPADAFSYGDPRGRSELRRALAEYVSRTRGVRTAPDRIVVCAGFMQGLGLLCEVLHRRGVRRLALEAYGVGAHRAIVRGRGLAIGCLPVDDRGARPAIGGLRDAGAIVVTPAHQFPLGAALAPERRSRAVAWAQKADAFVIEDDYDGEFRYDRQPVGAMQALDPERVVYCGTASKSLAPGLRLGWLALPAELVTAVADAQSLALGSVSAVDQLTLAELLTSGVYDRYVRRARLTYRRRRDQLLAMLARAAPAVEIVGIAAGLHAVLRLPAGSNAAKIVQDAAGRGLALEGLSEYATEPDAQDELALVVGYGTPPEHDYTAALARLAAVLTPAAPAGAPVQQKRPVRPARGPSDPTPDCVTRQDLGP